MRYVVRLCALLALAPIFTVCASEEPPPIIDEPELIPIAVDAGYHECFAALLDQGFQRQPDALSEAVARADGLREERPDDPRVSYALALIALRNFKQTEAIDHLEQAIVVDPAYLPAWRLRLGLQLKGKHYLETVERLYELADVVGRASPSPPDGELREQIAEYIGRVIAYLEGPLGDYEVAELCAPHARNLDALLGDDLHSAYTSGRIALTREHHALLDEEEILKAAAEADKEQQLADAAARGEELDTERQDVKRTQAEWDAIIKEEVGEIDSQLGALEKRHDSVRQELTTLANAITAMQLQISQLLAIRQSAEEEGRQNRRQVNATAIDLQIAACQAELAQYSAQYDAVSAEQAQIVRAGRSLVGQRDRALANYQRATGKAAERVQQLDRWIDKVDVGIGDTESSAAEDATVIKALRRRIRTWTTYEKSDLLAEKARLLAEYTVVP